jgi:hypothetical protein
MVNEWDARDGMRIGFDVPIAMDDGIVLRADVFAPEQDGEYPILMTYGPYAKGLHFEDGYPDAWRLMCEDHPDVPAGSTNKYQAWEVVDPEKWVREGYVCIRVDSRGAGRSPGVIDCFSPREVRDLYDCIEWAAEQPWSTGKVALCGISYYAVMQWRVAPQLTQLRDVLERERVGILVREEVLGVVERGTREPAGPRHRPGLQDRAGLLVEPDAEPVGDRLPEPLVVVHRPPPQVPVGARVPDTSREVGQRGALDEGRVRRPDDVGRRFVVARHA